MEERKKIYECKIKTTIIMEFINDAINIPDLQAFVLKIRDAATEHGFEDKRYVEEE